MSQNVVIRIIKFHTALVIIHSDNELIFSVTRVNGLLTEKTCGAENIFTKRNPGAVLKSKNDDLQYPLE
jgi:hypothetical protein